MSRRHKRSAETWIAVRIGPDMRFAVVAAPSYFVTRPEPTRPQDPRAHDCINLRLPTHGGLYAWEFEKDGRELKVHVDGQLVFNGTFQMLNAALAGLGLAYVPEDAAQPHLGKSRLKRVLEDWCPPRWGSHLYYPSRRQPTPAFALLVEALRYRGRASISLGQEPEGERSDPAAVSWRGRGRPAAVSAPWTP